MASWLVFDLETIPDLAFEADYGGDFPPIAHHRIVAIGWAQLDGRYRLERMGCYHGMDERDHIAKFCAQVESGERERTLVTWNGRGFDLPVLVHRALKHKVAIPWYYRRKGLRYRYSDEGHVDLADVLCDNGAARRTRLDDLATLLDIPGKTNTGGAVAELVADERWAELVEYCLRDVEITARGLARLALIRSSSDSPEWFDEAEASWKARAQGELF